MKIGKRGKEERERGRLEGRGRLRRERRRTMKCKKMWGGIKGRREAGKS